MKTPSKRTRKAPAAATAPLPTPPGFSDQDMLGGERAEHVRRTRERIRAERAEHGASPLADNHAAFHNAVRTYQRALQAHFPELKKGEQLSEERQAELRTFRETSAEGLAVNDSHAAFMAVSEGLPEDVVADAEAAIPAVADAPAKRRPRAKKSASPN